MIRTLIFGVAVALLSVPAASRDEHHGQAAEPVRVFVFAGQSNMVGSDSHADAIDRFPPFAGCGEELPAVRFWYLLGREEMRSSGGWIPLQPVDGVFGPELTFAREVAKNTKGPVAIVKIASGGTTLGRDWNPQEPGGFALYPKALATVRAALAELDRRKQPWRLEGFHWHQGENDMFEPPFRERYAENLTGFIASWRRDLATPDLRFYIGELCTNTVWGMDNREPMDAIARAQIAVADADPLVDYVPTSHVSVEIGGGNGLHYHYGTLGQLEHGVNHALAYLRHAKSDRPDAGSSARPSLPKWPYKKGDTVDLYVLLGHRNMEGERAFAQDLRGERKGTGLRAPRTDIAFRYHTGGGVHRSEGWEALRPAGLYDTFGPELSFASAIAKRSKRPIAIAKFTHAGSQIIDWTPEGSVAKRRNLYEAMLAFVKDAIADLESRGQTVRLAAIVYHLGENDMSWMPHRQRAPEWLEQIVASTRRDLAAPDLRWFVSQQRPTQGKDLDRFDVAAAVEKLADDDENLTWIRAFDPPAQPEQLVFDTAGILWLGESLAAAVAKSLR